MIQFPKEFTLEEMTRSDTAARLGIDNVPTGKELENLRNTAYFMVKVRDLLGGTPIHINSGYRGVKLNSHIPGSSNTSAHTLGWAADFTSKEWSPLMVAKRIAASELMDEVDQLIHEYNSWVHVSIDPRNRKQLLTISKNGAVPGLH